jgi:hypothetical protein
MKVFVTAVLLFSCSLFVSPDALALPMCSQIDPSSISNEQIDQAVEPVFAAKPLPWNYDFAALIVESAQLLGCEPDNYLEQLLPVFQNGFETPLGELLSTKGPDSPSSLAGCGGLGVFNCYANHCSCLNQAKESYCSCVSYCGDGDSSAGGTAPQLQNLLLIKASDQLNQLCYTHDRCYGQLCQQGVGCVFNTQNDAIVACDAPMDEYCLNSAAPVIDRIICKASKLLRAASNLFDCDSQNADSSYCEEGSMCLEESEVCSIPDKTNFQADIILTGPAEITGSSCTGTMTIEGVLTANFESAPTLVFDGTETIDLNCYFQSTEVHATIPLTINGTLISGELLQPFSCGPPCVSGVSKYYASLQLNRFFNWQSLVGLFGHTNQNQTPFYAESIGSVTIPEQQ